MTGRPIALRAAEVLFTAVVIAGFSASAGTPVSLADDGSAEPIPGYRQFLVLIYVDLDNDAATVNCSVWIKGGVAEPGIQDYVELSPTGHHSWGVLYRSPKLPPGQYRALINCQAFNNDGQGVGSAAQGWRDVQVRPQKSRSRTTIQLLAGPIGSAKFPIGNYRGDR